MLLGKTRKENVCSKKEESTRSREKEGSEEAHCDIKIENEKGWQWNKNRKWRRREESYL